MAYLLKYYTFSAKIRTLTDFHTRISCGQPPCTAEIMTVLRFFQQTLTGFIKELSTSNASLFEKFTADSQRTNSFPNLNFSGLFYGIVNLLEVFPLLTSGQKDIGQEILATFKSLYFFLDRDCIDQLPYLIASQIGVMPAELNKKIIHLLVECILPYTLSDEANGQLSVPCVMMSVLQHYNDPSLHTYLVENLMRMKPNVYNDIVVVVAKGTSEARVAAANLLFHYFPLINPSILHRKPVQYRIHAWAPASCESGSCTNSAVKLTYDPLVCVNVGNTAPPMRLCKSCADDVQSDQPTYFICQPMPASNSTVCQNKACESSNRFAVGTCFAEDCIRSHQHVPLRLCFECLHHLHSNPVAQGHIRHSRPSCAWNTIVERDMIEAIVKLLKETSISLEGTEGEGKRPKWLRQLEGGQSLGRDIDSMSDEKRMLSRYGIWLMVAMCPPSPEAPVHAIGYILSMVFQWFTTTALLPNDSMGASLEQLKTDFASEWVNQAITNHYDTFVLTLMPDVPDYAQVGGVWDKWCTRKDQLKEGLSKLLALMPYDVISFNTWSRVIPKWLHCICEEIDDEDFSELKILLCKIFEPDLCALPFDTDRIFEFISQRLSSGGYDEILDSLNWLHLLCRMDITMSLKMILSMFHSCLIRMIYLAPPNNKENDLEDDAGPLAVQVLMISIISQQIKLNENNLLEIQSLADELYSTASLLLQYPTTFDEHTCQNPETDQFSDCIRCQQAAFLFQIINGIVEHLCPKEEVRIEVDQTDRANWINDLQLTESGTTASHISNITSPRNPSVHAAVNSPLMAGVSVIDQPGCQYSGSLPYLTANVNEEVANDEFVGVLPSEEIETAVAQATTLTETDVGRETCQVVSATLFESLKGTPLQPRDATKMEFWNTSVGRFKFTLDQLPAQLRLIYSLLSNIDNEMNPDVQYFLLSTVKYLCLHCESLSNARREHRGFLIWAQENLLIPKLWTLLRSDYGQVGQLAVPLIIHAITLPCGDEVFWNTVNRDFTSDRWEVRFKSVERVFVLAHMIVEAPVKANKLLQTVLSCAFSHFIVSINDPSAAVSQKALLAIRSLPTNSLSIMNLCLESQFDSCIIDRPLIINRIILLTTVVPEEDILTWEFFINRFETLAVEAQLKFQSSEHGFVQGFANPDPMSETNQIKLSRARQSLNEADSVRSIVKSLRENSLKHQLTATARVEREQRQKAHEAMRARGRRGAAVGRDLARVKLQRVLMMVRVVNAFRQFTDRLRALTPIMRSRTTSPDFTTGNNSVGSGTIADTAALAGAYTAFPFDIGEDDPSFPRSRGRGLGDGGRLREFTDEESNLSLLLNRVVDMENPERHTIYLTVSLLVHFLCNRKSNPSAEKNSAKKQSLLLRYFNTLLGYSNSEKCFTIPPMRLRKAAICNAFLTGLPEILDNNLMIGNQLLPIVLQLLLHLPSPQKFASDQSSADYSLALLDLPARHSWLHTLIIILYKYRYDQVPINELIKKLIKIVIATIELHCHECPVDSEPKTTEYNIWSDSSEGEEAEEKIIREEEDDTSLDNSQSQMQDLSESKQLIRPESLKVSKTLSNTGGQLITFQTVETKLPTENPQPTIVEPTVTLHDPGERSEGSPIIPSITKSHYNSSGRRNSNSKVPVTTELKSSVTIMTFVMRIQNFSSLKSSVALIEAYSKWLTEVLHDCHVELRDLLAICTSCNRSLIRERDKQCLTRAIVNELIQAIKFKYEMVESNYMTIVEFIMQDYGEEISADLDQFNTGASEAIRPFMSDILEFIADLHVLSKLKKQTNSDRMGGDLKAGLAEIVALEMSRPTLRDCRPVMRYIPWLMSPPSVTQAVQGAFAESVTNVRILSWLLLGALHASHGCLPVPIDCSNHMADYIHFVLAGFADQSKVEPRSSHSHTSHSFHNPNQPPLQQSVVHMSALFHAFHLCQLWTVYCEKVSTGSDESSAKAIDYILDFWSRVTPAILQLLSHSKVLADMVNLHFVNTMQALQQCNSAILCQLYPMWQPILTAYHSQIPSQLRVKLDECENQPNLDSQPLSPWLKNVRYKISQIELQTSAASPFYNV
ncbi:hypothetical protein FO519_000706 [Halicephalobus sp. NKZ332]|nr:hypothetical protein FO519_000706 [Halicephalobus sp. NKZ332]